MTLKGACGWNFFFHDRFVHQEANVMAVNTGGGTRKGAVRRRTQRQTKMMTKQHWTKRSKGSGEFIDQKKVGRFKGVRREK
jgi:hypothetical protein